MDCEILATFSASSCGPLQLEASGALLLAAHRRTGFTVRPLAIAGGVHSEVLGTLLLSVSLSSKELEAFRCSAFGHATSRSIRTGAFGLGAISILHNSVEQQAFVTRQLGNPC